MNLQDKVAVITGASSGIGAAIATNLDAAGMKLVLTARSQQKLTELASKLQKAVILPGEITDPALPQQLLDKALAEFGQLDAVINNAGVMHMMSIEEADIEALCTMIRVNFEAVVRISYAMLPYLKQQGSGFIVNISSISGLKTTPMTGVYDGTKHALEAFTDSLRMELAGSGVGVATVEPGAVATNLYESWRDRGKQGFDEIVPDPLKSEDVARCVRFILEQPNGVLVPRLFVVPATSPV
ncbi:MAG: SDR family oxidoreductase [Stenomitos rutilans HA7619-LM2]|jgi:NADP-dependent 3-hydroxy acid dehydrogenase YdfG|nr:SDR family oxidoreductase [Stenomitos rutilans HA7619-LM2]